MTNLHNKPSKIAFIAGKIKASGSCSQVIGGTMTAGTFGAAGSGLITFDPPFISTPAIFASLEGWGVYTSNKTCVQLTGAGVSSVYVAIGTTPCSGATIHLLAMGEVRL